MPARGYQYFEVDSFPEWSVGNAFKTDHQDSMFPDIVESPLTKVTAVGIADHQDFNKYHVLHETYQKLRGRYQNKPINSYIAQVEFHIYLHQEHKKMFIDAPQKICKELNNRLMKSNIDYFAIPRNIDLLKLGNDLRERIRGGWFGELKVADVSTIGMFGPTVGESVEWERFEQIGRLKAIDVELDWMGQKLLVKIMVNRGIVFFENLTESQYLNQALAIQTDLDKYEIME